MKLEKALEIGIYCGLETVRECVRNIKHNAQNLFFWTRINEEMGELYRETEAVMRITPFTMDDKAEDMLDWLNKSESNILF